VLKSLLSLGFVVAFAAASAPAAAQVGPDFGEPPSGTVPILFNDHHVYAKPSGLAGNRVIAAIVQGGQVLVPLRSMFEQMGATVAYDAESRSIVVLAPQRSISLTIDRPVVVINGEPRPLDVPPVLQNGVVYVPVRVISETLGAYVQWDAALHVVVVRYLNLNNVPSPSSGPLVTPAPRGPAGAPAAPETPIPTPLFGAPPTTSPLEHFFVANYDVASKISNELSPGNKGAAGEFDVRGGTEFPLFKKTDWMFEGSYESFSYLHKVAPPLFTTLTNPCPIFGGTPPYPGAGNEGCVTVPGGYGQEWVRGFTAHESDFDARLGIKVFNPRVFVGASYLTMINDYAGLYTFPNLTGFGGGIEKLPDLENQISGYGGVWYYPVVSGNFTFPAGAPPALAGSTAKVEQQVMRYQAGGTASLGSLFLDIGFLGDTIHGKDLNPGNATHSAVYVGLGYHF
jgi:hypothetical protein